MTETYEEHMRQVLAAGGAHECASDCPLPAMTEDRVPITGTESTARRCEMQHDGSYRAMTEDRVPPYRLCTECGWQTRVDREYHPYAACLIYKASGNDPLMVLRQIAADVATLNDKGQFPVARPQLAAMTEDRVPTPAADELRDVLSTVRGFREPRRILAMLDAALDEAAAQPAPPLDVERLAQGAAPRACKRCGHHEGCSTRCCMNQAESCDFRAAPRAEGLDREAGDE